MSVRKNLKNCQEVKFKAMSDFILEYDKGYENLSSKELIERFFVSSAGISKFVKRLGVSSFPELKYNLLATQMIKEANKENILRDLIIPEDSELEYENLCLLVKSGIKFGIYTALEYDTYGEILKANFQDQISEQGSLLLVFGNPKPNITEKILQFTGEIYIIGVKEELYFCPGLENFHYIRFPKDRNKSTHQVLNLITYFIYDLEVRDKNKK